MVLVGQRFAAPDGILIVGCSVLKRRYRDHICAQAHGPVIFIHLAGRQELIATRMGARSGHFSQFAALEPPEADENSQSPSASTMRSKRLLPSMGIGYMATALWTAEL
ncbi:carbohydrate kinase (thermoresistant glucokinase family) [Rhizobium sp. BK060]|nr:carbohydrate kinase (thermoresistant glucokinase family) [Rhizobium sp. BK060]